MPEAVRSPIFIVGFPRSGTTLLRSIIGQHPRIHLFNQTEIVLSIYQAGYNIHSTFDLEARTRVYEDLKTGTGRRYLTELPEDLLDHIFTSNDEMTFKTFYESLLPHPANTDIWGTKTHWNLLFVPDLLQIYPQALFIHILRDGRASALSGAKKSIARSEQVTTTAFSDDELTVENAFDEGLRRIERWKVWLRFSEQLSASCPAGSFLQVKFEDLLAEPAATVQKICDAIHIEFDAGMLEAERRSDDPILATDTSYAHTKITEDFDRSRIAPHADADPVLLWIMERTASDELRRAGYELCHPAISPVSMGQVMFRHKFNRKLPRKTQNYEALLQSLFELNQSRLG